MTDLSERPTDEELILTGGLLMLVAYAAGTDEPTVAVPTRYLRNLANHLEGRMRQLGYTDEYLAQWGLPLTAATAGDES